MQVQMKLKNWKVDIEKKSGAPKVVGSYSLFLGEKEIASQEFNDGYNNTNLPFSSDLMRKIIDIEKDIILEITEILK